MSSAGFLLVFSLILVLDSRDELQQDMGMRIMRRGQREKAEAGLPLVVVAWIDATFHDAWMSLEDSDAKTCETLVFSVGFLRNCDKTEVRLVQNLAEDKECFGVLIIPKQWVQAIYELKVPKYERARKKP